MISTFYLCSITTELRLIEQLLEYIKLEDQRQTRIGIGLSTTPLELLANAS